MGEDLKRAMIFSVELILEESTRLFVGGRNCGALVRVEDEFTAACQDPGQPNGSDRPVSLKVKSILLYGKYMNQIDPGMTAELELERVTGAKPLVSEFLVGASALPPHADYEILGEGKFKSKPC